MGCLRKNGNECGYKEKDRRLKRQFIDGINDDKMTELIKKMTTIKNAITREQILA